MRTILLVLSLPVLPLIIAACVKPESERPLVAKEAAREEVQPTTLEADWTAVPGELRAQLWGDEIAPVASKSTALGIDALGRHLFSWRFSCNRDWSHAIVVVARVGTLFKVLGGDGFGWTKGNIPEVRIEHALSTTWIAMSGLNGSGSGVSLFEERWYMVGADSLKLSLAFPTRGYVNDWGQGFNREFNVRSSVRVAGKPRVTLYATCDFEMAGAGDEEYCGSLFQKTFSLELDWDASNGLFLAREPDAYDRMWGLWADGRNEFAERWFADLVDVAKSGSIHQKNWLKAWVKELDDSAAKSALGVALRGG